jgi:hypothetical protein
MRFALREAKPRDVRHIARHLREPDRIECAAMGLTPEGALRTGWAGSSQAWTAVLDGTPVAMMGVVPVDVINQIGRPWLLARDDAMRAVFAWAIHGPRVVEEMQAEFPRLENMVSARNAASIAFLRRLGFDVSEDLLWIGQEPFRRFTKGF